MTLPYPAANETPAYLDGAPPCTRCQHEADEHGTHRAITDALIEARRSLHTYGMHNHAGPESCPNMPCKKIADALALAYAEQRCAVEGCRCLAYDDEPPEPPERSRE